MRSAEPGPQRSALVSLPQAFSGSIPTSLCSETTFFPSPLRGLASPKPQYPCVKN